MLPAASNLLFLINRIVYLAKNITFLKLISLREGSALGPNCFPDNFKVFNDGQLFHSHSEFLITFKSSLADKVKHKWLESPLSRLMISNHLLVKRKQWLNDWILEVHITVWQKQTLMSRITDSVGLFFCKIFFLPCTSHLELLFMIEIFLYVYLFLYFFPLLYVY